MGEKRRRKRSESGEFEKAQERERKGKEDKEEWKKCRKVGKPHIRKQIVNAVEGITLFLKFLRMKLNFSPTPLLVNISFSVLFSMVIHGSVCLTCLRCIV